MNIFRDILLIFLIVCAVGASLSKRLLTSVVVFMSYSIIMSVVWLLLSAPDLAITEAAVGAGVSGILFLMTLRKIHQIDTDIASSKQEEKNEK